MDVPRDVVPCSLLVEKQIDAIMDVCHDVQAEVFVHIFQGYVSGIAFDLDSMHPSLRQHVFEVQGIFYQLSAEVMKLDSPIVSLTLVHDIVVGGPSTEL